MEGATINTIKQPASRENQSSHAYAQPGHRHSDEFSVGIAEQLTPNSFISNNRGFMTQNGQPDNPRSSRYLLKDFVNGRLLYCVAPPGMSQELYHKFPERCRNLPRHVTPATLRATKGNKFGDSGDVDRSFFNQGPGFNFKGKAAVATHSEGDKPWKKHNKHVNKNKREKLRRLHRNLDLH